MELASALFSDIWFLIASGTHQLGKTSWSQAPVTLLFCPPSARINAMWPHTWPLNVVLGSQTPVLMLAQQALC